MSETEHPALQRLLEHRDNAAALRRIGEELSGSDATSLLLAAMARRTASLVPTDVLAQYQRDRFVAPSLLDPVVLRRMELCALETLQPEFLPIELAPVAPLGTHSVFAGVHQNNVISTTRMSEVAADPTNQLALEAAIRRRRAT